MFLSHNKIANVQVCIVVYWYYTLFSFFWLTYVFKLSSGKELKVESMYVDDFF